MMFPRACRARTLRGRGQELDGGGMRRLRIVDCGLRIEKQQPPANGAPAKSMRRPANPGPFSFNSQSAIRNPQSRGDK